MRSLKAIVLLIMIDDIRDLPLLIEAALVNGIFGEIRLDDVEFAKMTSAVTIITDTVSLVVMFKVMSSQLTCCFIELLCLLLTMIVIMRTALSL